jgi:hypothetical protein
LVLLFGFFLLLALPVAGGRAGGSGNWDRGAKHAHQITSITNFYQLW